MANMKLLYIGVCRENLEKYYSSYIRNLIKKDCNYDFSSIKNSDIYNKLIDLNLEIKDIKDYIIKNG